MDVRVVVVYSDKLENITVNGYEMESLYSIRKKPIPDWFVPSNDRSGWEGLIQEIRRMLDDDEASIFFEFNGPKDSEKIFNEEISKYGYSFDIDGLDAEKIAELNVEEAKKAEHRGLYEEALSHYIDAAKYSDSPKITYSIAEYYFNFEERKIGCNREEAIEEALKYYEESAKKGYAKAQYQLYKILSTDEYVKKDVDKALEWRKMAADSGDDRAQIEEADKLYDDETDMISYYESELEANLESNTNLVAAFYLYMKLAEKGNDVAYMRVARSYKFGCGVHKDCEEAFKWYEKAMNAGNIRGYFQCAECYYEGIGVKEDKCRAYILYKKAAYLGAADACYKVGECYRCGFGVEEDQEKAFEWYLKSAKGGYVDAQNVVGCMYWDGLGVRRDPLQAEIWYLKAAEQWDTLAYFYLGTLYLSGDLGEADYEKAEKYLLPAAELGLTQAQVSLGKTYEAKYEGKDGSEKAFEWYNKAAENDDPLGQYNVGRCYDFGIGVGIDYDKALESYKKSMESGYSPAMYSLGISYEYGRGVDADMETAYQLYKKGADAKYSDGNCCFKIAEAYFTHWDYHDYGGRRGYPINVDVLIPITKEERRMDFIDTAAGKDMLKYYRLAASLGHYQALKRIKQNFKLRGILDEIGYKKQ